jgi:hypothetical protein
VIGSRDLTEHDVFPSAVHRRRRRSGSLGRLVDDPLWLMLGLRRGGRASSA